MRVRAYLSAFKRPAPIDLLVQTWKGPRSKRWAKVYKHASETPAACVCAQTRWSSVKAMPSSGWKEFGNLILVSQYPLPRGSSWTVWHALMDGKWSRRRSCRMQFRFGVTGWWRGC